jgi:hypothetical protein
MRTLQFLMLSFLTAVTLLCFPNINFAQAPNLRSAANFVIFTTTGAVGNTGISQITGNIGTNDGAITGFDDVGTLNGMKYNADPVTAQCADDLLLAYDQLNSTAQTIFPAHALILGNGEILTAGVYLIPGAGSINGILTLDAEDNPNAIFIFKIQGAFSPGPSSQISLMNGASASNIFWVVEGGAIAIATLSIMKGTFIAHPGAITMADGSTVQGRLLSTTGAINVDGVQAYLPASVVLPVTLLDFKATKANDAIGLLWTTANEFSLAKYNVERSATGNNFYSIGSVPSTNTSFIKVYQWLDNAPLAGVNFYRLKILDLDGTFKYSMVVKMDMNARKGISVYPNPVTGHLLLLQMYGQLKGDYFINLYNSNAEKMMSSRITHDGNDAVRSIPLNKNLPTAVYYLEISDPGKNKTTLKLYIN